MRKRNLSIISIWNKKPISFNWNCFQCVLFSYAIKSIDICNFHQNIKKAEKKLKGKRWDVNCLWLGNLLRLWLVRHVTYVNGVRFGMELSATHFTRRCVGGCWLIDSILEFSWIARVACVFRSGQGFLQEESEREMESSEMRRRRRSRGIQRDEKGNNE